MKKNIILVSLVILLIIILIVLFNTFRTYDVYFDSQGGTSVAVQKVRKGELVDIPETPILSGYTFEGWYLDGELFDFDTKIEKEITLTGKWTEN